MTVSRRVIYQENLGQVKLEVANYSFVAHADRYVTLPMAFLMLLLFFKSRISISHNIRISRKKIRVFQSFPK